MINGKILRDAFISGANNITNNREMIDQLNVFPVPDGDTGTNMSMTISSSVRELSRLSDPTATQVADTAASAFCAAHAATRELFSRCCSAVYQKD